MGGERLRPLTGLARAAGVLAGRALPARRRIGAYAAAGGIALDPAVAAAATPRAAERPVAGRAEHLVSLRILTVTDFHGALLSAGERDGRPVGGAAYLAAYLRREREARPERTLLLHNGDVVGLSPAVSGLLLDEPAVALFDALGCDAGVVGNHEFDKGLDELFRLLDGGAHPTTLWRSGSFPGCAFPWLAANVLSEATGHPILPAYRIFEIAGGRVGVIGVVTTETPRRVGGGTLGLRFADEAATVNRYVNELRSGRDAVQAIVVLAHLGGTSQSGTVAGPVGGPLARFAAALDDGVDVIVGGHIHNHSFVATVGGRLVVQGPPFGAAYGVIDLQIDPVAGRVVNRSATLVPVWQDAIAPDPEVARLIAGAQHAAAPLAAEPAGHPGHSLQRRPDDAGLPPLGEIVAQAFIRATGADVAVVHESEVRADLPDRDLTRADAYAVLPGGHALVTIRLSGEQLRRFLDEQWTRDRTARLHLAGFVAEVAPEAPLGQRVRRLRLPDGQPLDRGRTYAVAMTSFLAGGGDNFRVPLAAADRIPGPPALDALVAYLRALPALAAAIPTTPAVSVPVASPSGNPPVAAR